MSTNPVTDVVRRSAKVSDDELARLNLDEALREMLAEVTREPRSEKRQRRRGSWLARRTSAFGIRLTRPAMAALLIVAVVVGTAAAVPPVRAALGKLGDTLAGYLNGDDPPGRPLEGSGSAPAWLVSEGYTGQRVIASSGPYSLYLAHKPGGDYSFGLDDSVGIGDSAAGWERQFADNSVVILGPGGRPDADRVPLYGVTAGDVTEVELRYEDGSTTKAPAQTGGFVLLIDPTNGPAEIVALGRDGEAIQTVAAHRFAREPTGHETDRARPAHPKRHRRVVVPQGTVQVPDGQLPRDQRPDK